MLVHLLVSSLGVLLPVLGALLPDKALALVTLAASVPPVALICDQAIRRALARRTRARRSQIILPAGDWHTKVNPHPMTEADARAALEKYLPKAALDALSNLSIRILPPGHEREDKEYRLAGDAAAFTNVRTGEVTLTKTAWPSIMVHESGHVLAKLTTGSADGGSTTLASFMAAHHRRPEGTLPITPDGAPGTAGAYFISPYAGSDPGEFFAECWRAFCEANEPGVAFPETWPLATRARLKALHPTMFYFFDRRFGSGLEVDEKNGRAEVAAELAPVEGSPQLALAILIDKVRSGKLSEAGAIDELADALGVKRPAAFPAIEPDPLNVDAWNQPLPDEPFDYSADHSGATTGFDYSADHAKWNVAQAALEIASALGLAAQGYAGFEQWSPTEKPHDATCIRPEGHDGYCKATGYVCTDCGSWAPSPVCGCGGTAEPWTRAVPALCPNDHEIDEALGRLEQELAALSSYVHAYGCPDGSKPVGHFTKLDGPAFCRFCRQPMQSLDNLKACPVTYPAEPTYAEQRQEYANETEGAKVGSPQYEEALAELRAALGGGA